MKYQIKYTYDTGDSFRKHPNRVGYLEAVWSNLDVAKDNLRRIKEHYEYYISEPNIHLSNKEKKLLNWK